MVLQGQRIRWNIFLWWVACKIKKHLKFLYRTRFRVGFLFWCISLMVGHLVVDQVGLGSNPGCTAMRGGVASPDWPHKSDLTGSIPVPATILV